MMHWVTELNNAINYIEGHLTENIKYETIAAKCYCSVYHFQRVFHALNGFTLGEYIRNRRLTLAGIELTKGKKRVIDIALQYGYENPDSFAKAFQKFHGVSPSQAKNHGVELRSFSPLVLQTSLQGGKTMNYKIKQLSQLCITGQSVVFDGIPKNRKQQQHDFMVDGNVRFIRYALQGMAGDCDTEYCVISHVTEDSFQFTIGTVVPTYFSNHLEKTVGNYAQKLETLLIPAETYVSMETTQSVDYMNEQAELYKRMVEEWLPDSGYLLKNAPELTILHHAREHSYVEVLIPIEKSE